jgi:hypothetical protein
MRFLNRRVVFGTVTVLAAGFAAAGVIRDERVFAGAWNQLSWLTLGILVTSFVIESLLSRDLQAQCRREDQFAFRTFAGEPLERLAGMVGIAPAPQASVMAAAIETPKVFAQVAKAAAERIIAAQTINPDAYTRSYIDVSSALRNLAVGYIRLLASSRREMIEIYGRLLALAACREYRDALSAGFRRSTEEFLDGDSLKATRRQETVRASADALSVVHDTAAFLATLAEHAVRRGTPSAPTS